MAVTTVEVSKAFKLNFGRVLIIDADSMSGELLQMRLESDGFESDIVTDGVKALERDLSKYDVIILR